MCYCDEPDAVILEDIQRAGVPEEALVNACCWARVCQVRGRNFWSVDPETWREICRTRGYLLARQNPRGF